VNLSVAAGDFVLHTLICRMIANTNPMKATWSHCDRSFIPLAPSKANVPGPAHVA
jgi:hypothetical protein